MFCPLCGKELILVIRPESKDDEEINFQVWDFTKKVLKITNSNPEWDESEWYKCDNCHSFGDDYPLVLHHPLRGMKSRPGDSWSLSWLK